MTAAITPRTWIDRLSPIPLHEQCKRIILGRIERGDLKPGDAIPPERVLCELYGLSRTTVRAATDDLVQQGVLQRAQGRGTFVTRRALPLDLHALTSFSEDMRARGRTPGARILFVGLVPADPRVADALHTSGEVMKLERLRTADGQVMGLHSSYLPRALEVTRSDLEREPSLYNNLARTYHIEFTNADETLAATAATAEDGRLLEVEPGAPILRVERLSYNARGEPTELCIMRYRADQYTYYARLIRH